MKPSQNMPKISEAYKLPALKDYANNRYKNAASAFDSY